MIGRWLSLSAVVVVLSSPLLRAQDDLESALFLTNVRLGDRSGDATYDVVVRDGLIASVEKHDPAREAPYDAKVVKLDGAWLFSGVFDAYSGVRAPAAATPATTESTQRPTRGTGGRRPGGRRPGGRRGRGGAPASDADAFSKVGDLEKRSWTQRGIHAARQAVDTISASKDGDTELLKAGVTARHIFITSDLVSGQGALVSTGPGEKEARIFSPATALHVQFRGSRGGYPSTLMGCMAQLRQLFLDAQHHGEWKRQFASSPRGIRRPPFDATLGVVHEALAGERALVFWCGGANDARRALKLGREFGFKPTVAGGTDLVNCADELASAGVPVILAVDVPDVKYESNKELVKLGDDEARGRGGMRRGGMRRGGGRRGGRRGDFGPGGRRGGRRPGGEERREADAGDTSVEEAKKDETAAQDESAAKPEEKEQEAKKKELSDIEKASVAYATHERKKREAKEKKDALEALTAARKLADAGVRFSFGSGARGSANDLLKFARLSVKHGLPREAALAALSGAHDRSFGGGEEPTLVAGGPGTFLITSAHLLDETAKIQGAVIDGHHVEISTSGGARSGGGASSAADIAKVLGTWEVEMRMMGEGATMTLTKSGDGFGGTINGERGESTVTNGSVKGDKVTFSIEISFGDRSFSLDVDATVKGDTMTGAIESQMGTIDFTATKKPGGAR